MEVVIKRKGLKNHVRKTLLTLLLAGSLLGCGTPDPISPNTNRKIFKGDTTQTHSDTTRVLVNRNDLAMRIDLYKYALNDTLEYKGTMQTLAGDDTLTIDNKLDYSLPKAIHYSVYRNGQEFAGRWDMSRAIISLYDNGYISSQTDGDSVNTEISNAHVIANVYDFKANQDKHYDVNIPYPITVDIKSKRDSVGSEVVKLGGDYFIQTNIDYSLRDTSYHAEFQSQHFNVSGGSTWVQPFSIRRLDMKGKTWRRGNEKRK